MKLFTNKLKLCVLLFLFISDIPLSTQYQINNPQTSLINGVSELESRFAEKMSHKENEDEFIEGDPEAYRFKDETTEEKNEYTLNADVYETKLPASTTDIENEVFPKTAKAGTTYVWSFLFWKKNDYAATCAISNKPKYWMSRKRVKNDYWEAYFDKPTKISKIVIDWKNAPKRFKVFFNYDSTKSEYIPATPNYSKFDHVTKSATKSSKSALSLENTIIFNRPILAKQIKIAMSEPINNSFFAINSVSFYEMTNHIIIKNEVLLKSTQLCLFVNSNKIKVGEVVEAYSCLEAVGIGNNNEIFIQDINKSIRHMNSGLCLGFNKASELALTKCSKYAPPFTLQARSDLSLFFTGYPNKCLVIDITNKSNVNFISPLTEVITTSDLDNSYSKKNLINDGETYWHSAPGDPKVTLQILFGKTATGEIESKKIDMIKLEWIREPKEFSVYTWNQGQTWILRQMFKDNESKQSEIPLYGVEASGLMLVLKKSNNQADLADLPAYALKSVFVGADTYKVKFEECNAYTEKSRTFDFEPQLFFQNPNTQKANDEFNTLTVSFEKVLSLYKQIKEKWSYISAIKEHMSQYKKHFDIIQTKQKTIIQTVYNFQSTQLNVIENKAFETLAKKYNNPIIPNSSSQFEPYGSEDNPALDCFSIKKEQSSAKNGFYYIKSECYAHVLKVYCDFTSYGTAIDYYIYGDPNEDLAYMKIQNYNTIRFRCAKKGLFPIEIKNEAMVSTIKTILKEEGFNMSENQVVPLGYDYGCDNNQCKGMYKSMNNINTAPINAIFSQMNESIESGKTMIGIGYGDGFKKFDPNKEKITALICSTNRFGKNSSSINVKNISCGMNVRSNKNIFKDGSSVLVNCPSNCSPNEGAVYGTGIFMEDSSICLSAIHFGEITSKGGKFFVKVVNGSSKFTSSNGNGILSKDFVNLGKQRKGFFITKYKPKCPLDNYGGRTSFLELGATYRRPKFVGNYSNKMGEVGQLLNNKALNIAEEAQKMINKEGEKILGDPDEAMKLGAKLGNTGISNSLNSLLEKIQNKKNSINQNQDQQQSLNVLADNQEVTNPIERSDEPRPYDPSNSDNAEAPFPVIEPTDEEALNVDESVLDAPETTTSVYEKLEEIFKSGNLKQLSEMTQKITSIKERIKEFLNNLSWSDSKELSSSSIKELIHQFYKKRKNMMLLINQLQRKADLRISRTRKLLYTLESEYKTKKRGTDYKGKSGKVSSQGGCSSSDASGSEGSSSNSNQSQGTILGQTLQDFSSYIFGTSTNQQAKREWKEMPMQNHENTIGIQFNSFNNNAANGLIYDSLIFLKYGKWFDFEASVDIMLIEGTSGGIAFRVKNEFNFYALEIKHNSVNLHVIKNGRNTVIASSINKSIPLNAWLKVFINCKTSNIDIKISSNSYEIVALSAINTNFASGAIGAFSFRSTFKFDNIEVKALPCSTQWKPSKSSPIIFTNKASAYVEKFSSSLISQKMIIIEPDESTNGPSVWKVISNARGNRYVGLKQDSIVSYNGDERTYAIYKSLWLTNGILKVNFMPETQGGILTFLFKYNPETKTYYSFEMDNIKKKIFLMKYIDGKGDVLAEANGNYNLNYIQNLMISVEEGKIEVGLAAKGSGYTIYLKAQDRSIETGTIGFGVSGTKCIFTHIELMPNLENNLVDTETIEKSKRLYQCRCTNPESCTSCKNRMGESSANKSKEGQSTSEKTGKNVNININNKEQKPGAKDNTKNKENKGNNEKGNRNNGKTKDNEKRNKDKEKNAEGNETTESITEKEETSESITEEKSESIIEKEETSESNIEKQEENKSSSSSTEKSKYNTEFLFEKTPISWQVCIDQKTSTQREDYCNSIRDISVKERCKKNFCNECCDYNTPPAKRNISHQCKKQCSRTIQFEKDEAEDYENICLVPDERMAPRYKDCDNNPEIGIRQICKKDLCKLCCSTLEKLTGKIYSPDTIMTCTSKCETEFLFIYKF